MRAARLTNSCCMLTLAVNCQGFRASSLTVPLSCHTCDVRHYDAGWRVPAAHRLRAKARLRCHVHTEEREGRISYQVRPHHTYYYSPCHPQACSLIFVARSQHLIGSDSRTQHCTLAAPAWPGVAFVRLQPIWIAQLMLQLLMFMLTLAHLLQGGVDLPRAGHPADHAG